jgi:hypothetical protein
MPLTGPLSGAGLGYCTKSQAIKSMDAAKEYYVAKRTTLDGRPCRLPMISGSAPAPCSTPWMLQFCCGLPLPS